MEGRQEGSEKRGPEPTLEILKKNILNVLEIFKKLAREPEDKQQIETINANPHLG